MVIDGRTELGRRVRDLAETFALRLGGWPGLSELQAMAVRRAAEMVALCEQARADALRQCSVNPDLLLRLEGAADRAVRRLNLDRKRESAAASGLTGYLASLTTEQAAEEAPEAVVVPAAVAAPLPGSTGDEAGASTRGKAEANE